MPAQQGGGAKSKSPKRSESPKRRKISAEDLLLDARAATNVVEVPHTQFWALSFVMSLLPVYLATAYFEVALNLTHTAMFLTVSVAVAYMLEQAYSMSFMSEWLKRDSAVAEMKNQDDANLLRNLRLEVSMARSMFNINMFFLGISTLLQLYVFKKTDPRAAFVMAPLLAGLISWFVGYKSESSTKKKIEGTE